LWPEADIERRQSGAAPRRVSAVGSY